MFLRFIQNNKFFKKTVASLSLSREKFQSIVFFTLILFLPTQLGKHFWPAFAFVDGIRVDYLSPTIYVTDILVVLYILLSLPNIRIPKIFLPILLFVSIGIFLSVNPFAGWYALIKFVEFALLGITIAHTFKKHVQRVVAGISLGLGILMESGIAFLQFLHQGSIGGLLYFLGERTFSSDTPGIANASINGQLILRPYATLPHPNVLAGYMLISLLLMVGLLGKTPSKKMFVFLVITCVAGILGIFLSLSRSAIVLTVVLGIIFFFWKVFRAKKRSQILFVFFTILVGISFLSIFSSLLFGRFTFSLTDESVVEREQLTMAAVQMIEKSPVFGVGFGNFFTSVAERGIYSSFFLLLQPVHNIFLFLAATAGLPFLFFALRFLWKTLTALFKTSSENFYMTALFVSLLSILLLGQLDHYFVTIQQGQLLTTLVLGLSWNAIFTGKHPA